MRRNHRQREPAAHRSGPQGTCAPDSTLDTSHLDTLHRYAILVTLLPLEHGTRTTMDLQQEMTKYHHEQLVISSDPSSGYFGIIAIHDTTLGPALGGTRFWQYASTEAAVIDALRLSRGMTYKAAVAGVNLGGGKAVIVGRQQALRSRGAVPGPRAVRRVAQRPVRHRRGRRNQPRRHGAHPLRDGARGRTPRPFRRSLAGDGLRRLHGDEGRGQGAVGVGQPDRAGPWRSRGVATSRLTCAVSSTRRGPG